MTDYTIQVKKKANLYIDRLVEQAPHLRTVINTDKNRVILRDVLCQLIHGLVGDCVPYEGEPSFTLLARDPQAPYLVDDWAAERSSLAPAQTLKVSSAFERASAMRAWKADHPNLSLPNYQRQPHAPTAYIIANANEDQFRFWDLGPEWTADRSKALHFARRSDAEEFSKDDEDAWKILEVIPVFGIRSVPGNETIYKQPTKIEPAHDARDALGPWRKLPLGLKMALVINGPNDPVPADSRYEVEEIQIHSWNRLEEQQRLALVRTVDFLCKLLWNEGCLGEAFAKPIDDIIPAQPDSGELAEETKREAGSAGSLLITRIHRVLSAPADVWSVSDITPLLADCSNWIKRYSQEQVVILGTPQPEDLAAFRREVMGGHIILLDADQKPMMAPVDTYGAADVLRVFAGFINLNVTQWQMGAGDHHHPIWELIAINIEGEYPSGGPEWKFIQPLNRQKLNVLIALDNDANQRIVIPIDENDPPHMQSFPDFQAYAEEHHIVFPGEIAALKRNYERLVNLKTDDQLRFVSIMADPSPRVRLGGTLDKAP